MIRLNIRVYLILETQRVIFHMLAPSRIHIDHSKLVELIFNLQTSGCYDLPKNLVGYKPSTGWPLEGFEVLYFSPKRLQQPCLKSIWQRITFCASRQRFLKSWSIHRLCQFIYQQVTSQGHWPEGVLFAWTSKNHISFRAPPKILLLATPLQSYMYLFGLMHTSPNRRSVIVRVNLQAGEKGRVSFHISHKYLESYTFVL